MASSSGCAREEVAPSSHDAAGKVERGSRSEAPQTNQRFPRSYRLTARRTVRRGVQPGPEGPPAGFHGIRTTQRGRPVSDRADRDAKRTGNAVARNRIKRKLRDVFRRHRDRMHRRHGSGGQRQSAILKMSAIRDSRARVSLGRWRAGAEGVVVIVRRAVIGLIVAYKRWISPLFPPACRFHPTCSEYAREAVELHGVWRGGGSGAVAPATLPAVQPRRVRPRPPSVPPGQRAANRRVSEKRRVSPHG